MSDQRKTQWTHRLEHLLALRERFTAAHQYTRAYETYLTIQHVYDLWADEMFRSRVAHSPLAGLGRSSRPR